MFAELCKYLTAYFYGRDDYVHLVFFFAVARSAPNGAEHFFVYKIIQWVHHWKITSKSIFYAEHLCFNALCHLFYRLRERGQKHT